ncbi:PAS/PAC sensor hybrid histidine kinase [Trichormus variabilis ATCC 29413]|uniref:Circadian input-output histidine kinase CikA n=2 Tax=Anabaena variabilis TaxID=264691 RepID=Q3MG98_TRIV2|nr:MULTISPECIES: PAS domain-containing protein [Nostocaceae]ABA19988.1 PAS/PAC sensor hybrid histidine kinase [Trichormus variabilis ATCC 29413]MBC1216445.1 PAS domain-containing protein [Trichormus variabilis ARAD]MBC1257900.1 PAS domain-containing protein [Trichormus variabilis V5]MBC1305139.1 PAS domain-containing protein [Trichormus variabilis N2B]MBC1314305.1 PAS domain-containing protein [Trichormus variabilis PNB]
MKRDTTGKFVSNWDSEPKHRYSVSLTSTAWRSLDEEAHKQGISRSELIEHFARHLGSEQNLTDEVISVNAGNAEQQPILATVFNQDINNHQQLQLVTSPETECQVTTILESITDAFVAFDENWHYTYVNQAAVKILHKTPVELIGKHVWDEVFPELVGGVAYQELHRAVAEQVAVSWEEFGESVQCCLEANAYPFAQGVAVYFRDITERKKAEAERERLLHELETERTRFEAVLRQMPAGVMIADADSGKLVLTNEQAKQILRYNFEDSLELEEYVPVTPFAAFRCDGQPYTPYEYPLPRSLLTGEVISQEEMLLRWEDNSHIFISVNSAPILNSQGQIVAAAIVFQDITERKRLESELQQREQEFKMVAENAPDIISRVDREFRHLYVSPAVEAATGIPPEVFIGKTNTELGMPEEICTFWHENLQRAFDTGQKQVVEFSFPTPTGLRWYQSHLAPEFASDGSATTLVNIARDVTDYKRIEQALLDNEERLRLALTVAQAAQRQLATIFETSPVGIALLDSQQRFVAINQALAQINGLTRQEHLGRSITELFGESDPQVVQVFHDIYTTGEPFISPSFAVNLPGRSDRQPGYYNVYYLPTTNSNHQVEDVLVYVLDVTEQVRLERGLRFLSETSKVLASSLDYQTTLERLAQLAVPELADWCTVHMVAENGSVEEIAVAHVDPAKLAWAEEIRRKYPLNLNDPRGAALTLRTGQSDLLIDIPDELLVQAARDPEHLEILRQVGFKSAMTVPLRTQTRTLGVISFICAESGHKYDQSSMQLAEELAYRASLAIDNAHLYRLAQSDRTKAEAANRIKDEFLAVLSHELRSPLNPILGWSRILRTKQLSPTKVDQALETIERNAKLQAQLIEDLLDVSRILQGKMTLNVAPVNLAATITAALETVQLAAEAKNIHIQTTLKPIAGNVVGDQNRLQQVIWNLLSNAVKFTPSGGQIEVQLAQVNLYAQIQVKDSGKGIAREFLPYVFEYFRQEDGATTRKFGGLGLGLAIVRHFTELHGGTVHVSSLGQDLGATFTVRLPLNLVEQELPADDEQLKKVTDLTGTHILVVDDDADMRELAEFILIQFGAQVTTAASAVEALNIFSHFIPDLLLCDIGMPEMDGYSLMRQIRQWLPHEGGTIPAIALTAYAGEINQQQALAAGFHQHISKPVEPEELVQTIFQLLHPVQ